MTAPLAPVPAEPYRPPLEVPPAEAGEANGEQGKGRRGVNTLAVLFLGAVGLACVVALGYHAIVNGSEAAINSLSIIAGSAIGAIAGLLSSKPHEQNSGQR